ncbi:Hsp20/alpha crystallin family protein [Thioalkalivibrio sp. ALJ16]|uniref:Hsp20/alpha crystallin family protein n=1 Tax=Thioalkalivibrio sp. ALJ16 TaxID=1158762 RepID=UPI000370872E|nr:Hsp20/alpha crystallin family protein [Thioalkalivibrio sp. ALJ16]
MPATLRLYPALAFLALLLAACSPRIYGVSEEQWDAMGEAERVEAIRAWESVQKAREARLQAEAEQEAALAAERAERVAAIRNGQAGLPGDLIRVSLSGGTLRIGGRERALEPTAFTLASGESRRIEVHAERYRSELEVAFDDGLLLIDLPRHSRTGAARLAWDGAWMQGAETRIDSEGPHRLRDVRAYVQVIPPPLRAPRR